MKCFGANRSSDWWDTRWQTPFILSARVFFIHWFRSRARLWVYLIQTLTNRTVSWQKHLLGFSSARRSAEKPSNSRQQTQLVSAPRSHTHTLTWTHLTLLIISMKKTWSSNIMAIADDSKSTLFVWQRVGSRFLPKPTALIRKHTGEWIICWTVSLCAWTNHASSEALLFVCALKLLARTNLEGNMFLKR